MNIIESLKKVDLSIPWDYNSNSVYVKKTTGSLFIGFVASYTKVTRDYIDASYDNPEEYSVNFELTEISELEIYVNNNLVDDDDVYELAQNYIENILIGKNYSSC